MDANHRTEKLTSLIGELAAEFLSRESNRTSLLTVTSVSLSNKGKYATIFFTVFPDEKEHAALEFANRKVGEFKEFVASRARIGNIPFFEFKIDAGEKHRQRIDEISKDAL